MRHASLLCGAGVGGCLLAAGLCYGLGGLRAAGGVTGAMVLVGVFFRVILDLRWPGRLVVVPVLGWIPGVMLCWAVENLQERRLALLTLGAGSLALQAIVHFHKRSPAG